MSLAAHPFRCVEYWIFVLNFLTALAWRKQQPIFKLKIRHVQIDALPRTQVSKWDAYKFKLTLNYFIAGEEDDKGKRTIPGTNVKLTSVDKPQKIWRKSWEKTLGESKLFSKMIEELLKGAIKTSGWLQLDLILYGPRTILNSFGISNLFG